jgi:hypothetical protein
MTARPYEDGRPAADNITAATRHQSQQGTCVMGNTGFLNIRKGGGGHHAQLSDNVRAKELPGGIVHDAVLTAIDPDRFLGAELAGM